VKTGKLVYRPVSLGGALAGIVAGVLFKQVWRLVSGEQETPDALDERRPWAEVLATAALQGAIFALVKAAFDRAAAQGVQHLTGHWPR
jgi:predicted metal-dependent enzyme (double-stranded beta helix superfamily)